MADVWKKCWEFSYSHWGVWASSPGQETGFPGCGSCGEYRSAGEQSGSFSAMHMFGSKGWGC